MAEQGGVLRRKLNGARQGDAAPGGETGARAWRVAFARAARETIGLDLAVPVLRDDRRSLGEVLEMLPDRAFLAVLEGPGQGLGLLMMSPEVLASVIEMQTIGRVAATTPLPRRPTRTDAAMSIRLIDTALSMLETALACASDLTWTGGFRYASFLEQARPLGLLLDDVPYRVLVCDLDIAAGARSGRVLLALPAEGRGPMPANPPPSGETPVTAQAWRAGLSGAVLGAEVVMDAVIGTMRLPLAQAMALEVGMLLPLPDARVDSVRLLVPGGEGMATGKLGQTRGMRAIRLQQVQGADQTEPAVEQPACDAEPGQRLVAIRPTAEAKPEARPLARSA